MLVVVRVLEVEELDVVLLVLDVEELDDVDVDELDDVDVVVLVLVVREVEELEEVELELELLVVVLVEDVTNTFSVELVLGSVRAVEVDEVGVIKTVGPTSLLGVEGGGCLIVAVPAAGDFGR